VERQRGRPEDFDVAENDRECFICRGLTGTMDTLVTAAVKEARRYEFKTFAIGLSMPEGVLEREDELRSAMRLKGRETIKLQLSAAIAGAASRTLRKEIDKAKPDLTLIVDLSRLRVRASSRPLFFFGRYTKTRGVTQKREWCPSCRGKGCAECKLTGFDRSSPSVEGLVRRKLSSCGSHNMTFTWLGSEDKDSLVLPPGRPFLVEIKNPVKRSLPKRFTVRSRRGQVNVSRGKILPVRPVKLPSFRFQTRIFATTQAAPDGDALKELRARFSDAMVRFDRPYNKPAFKRVTGMRARVREGELIIDAELDGGLPVKRFVSGESVSPSVSEVLKAEVRCRNFDIRRVMETSDFELA
jgi:tRNA pseudouridine synthase 10